ncbi:MAG: TonB-dependent receptor plug domain-containing protein [Ferruginibacter sp.]|nr:TonB-dependent receptor plug domain-containing protein [Cytophagales bacterium]
MKKLFGLLAFAWLSAGQVGLAQSPAGRDTTRALDYAAMSLEDLLQLKDAGVSSELEKTINSLIGVASQKPQSTRKTPSIITLVTEEEIAASGARDLVDVLRLVPGFDFAGDIQNTLGLGVRGNWAAEGKVLVLLDGQEINDALYGNVSFGNHFDVGQIKRIEIIRGPGSAIYGGFAEYGVVSILTKNADDLGGLRVSGTYGRMRGAYGRQNLSVSVGKRWRDLGVSLALFTGQGNRSDQTSYNYYSPVERLDTVYTDETVDRVDTVYQDSRFAMAGNSALNPFNVNLGITYRGLSFRGIVDQYRTTSRSLYGFTTPQAYPLNFDSYLAELKYVWKINRKLSVTPRLNWKRQMPWRNVVDSQEYEVFDVAASRYRAGLAFSYDASRMVNFMLGGELFNDRSQYQQDAMVTRYGENTRPTLRNRAGFGQVLVKHRLAQLTLGARFDYNSGYGYAFVPRLGITQKWNHWHAKLLYANSFRAPVMENIYLAAEGKIRPEETRIAEVEIGYQLSKAMLLTANVFDARTDYPIVFYTEEGNPDGGYTNFDRTGSRGLEVEYRVKDNWGFLKLNHSFYTSAGRQGVPLYAVAGHSNLNLAFPAHRLNGVGNVQLKRGWSISPSGSWLSTRHGYVAADSIAAFPPTLLLNLFVQYQPRRVKGLTAGVGVYDLLDERFVFLPAYYNDTAPLPGPSREVVVRLTYHLFKPKK